jgi:glycosyltransferase involved in cell wall biosynthesis
MPSLSPTPLVSIIMPSYNQGQFIEASIRSVLEQDYPKIEFIIVDGGSKDESVEIIQKYQDRLAWWVSEKDQGQTDALDKGFAHASGEVLAWLNSDDTYFPGTIREAVAFLKDHPQVGMVYAGARLIDDQGKTIGQFAARQTDYHSMLRGSVHIPQATTFFRADLWRQVGPLDISLYYAFDYDLWVKLARVSEIRYLPRQWASFRIHSQGKTIMADDRCYPEMIGIRERELGKGFSVLHLRAFIRKTFYTRIPVRLRLWLRKALTF